MPKTFAQRNLQSLALLLAVPLVLTVALELVGPHAFAQEPQLLSEENVAERAKEMWENADINGALDTLDQWIEDNPNAPHALTVHKLRGDILATSRRPQEAVAAYETVLARKPTALNVRWAKWSVLLRSGQGEESIAELQRIAQVDVQNPLVHLRLAQELRRLDRLEESLVPYKKAVELAPDLLSWRLGLARARFDILDYQGAQEEVHYVLQRVPPGSPLEIPARDMMSAVISPSSDRGRRATIEFTPDATPEQLEEWAFLRGDAWKLYAAGRFKEAEPLYRRLLVLNPRDPAAIHQLGRILIELDRCEEALAIFPIMSNYDPNEEEYADSLFRMGQCLVDLKRWSEALLYFQVLYNAAVEFEENTKHLRLPSGTRVLSAAKLAEWLEKVRPHVPESEIPKVDAAAGTTGPTEKDLFAKIAEAPLKPQKPLETRASLMGRDADFSWFRYVIPASKVMRDDFPTGYHEFIPLNPGDSFPTTQREIYMVFGLVSASDDEVPLSAKCFLETSELNGEPRPFAQDHVIMSMNDQSGYLRISPPATGWTPGLYRCGLFMGGRTSAYTHVDEVRFRILQPAKSS